MSGILDGLMQSFGGDVVAGMAKQMGADSAVTQMLIKAAVPMVIGAMSRNASNMKGAESLTKALERDHDGGILDDLKGFVTGGANEDDGNGILKHVLGDRRAGVEQELAKESGMNPATIAKGLAIVAPIVMAYLGRKKRQENLDPAGMAAILGGERQRADEGMGMLARIIDADDDGNIADDLLGMGAKIVGGFLGGK